jgi:hypothetical protein
MRAKLCQWALSNEHDATSTVRRWLLYGYATAGIGFPYPYWRFVGSCWPAWLRTLYVAIFSLTGLCRVRADGKRLLGKIEEAG